MTLIFAVQEVSIEEDEDITGSLQPLVSLEEGRISLEVMSPIEQIPSTSEAAVLLSKALVWAAAQPDTSPQELYVLKQLQTKAALRGIVKTRH